VFLIDKQKKRATSLKKVSFSKLKLREREDLQEWIANNPKILGEDLLIIQKEFSGFQDTGERLDLLALDKQGRLVVIENKLDDSGRDVVWQALKYVSYCATLTQHEIYEIYQEYLGNGGNAAEKIAEFYTEQEHEDIQLNPAGSDQRIILVAANFRKEVTSTVLWLLDHSIDITCIKVTPYVDNEKLYLAAEQILPIQDIGDYQIRRAAKKQEDMASSKEAATRRKLFSRLWEKARLALCEVSDVFGNAPFKAMAVEIPTSYNGIHFSAYRNWNRVIAALCIDTNDQAQNKQIFHALATQKDDIERAFDGKILWSDYPDKKHCRICVRCDLDVYDEKNWDEIIAFLVDKYPKLISALKTPLENVMEAMKS